LTSIPPGSSVERVTLEVYVLNESRQAIITYPLRASWSERTVSWILRDTMTPWEVPGARGELDCGSAVGNLYLDIRGWRSVPLNDQTIALIQSWVDAPATNFGINLTGDGNTDGLAIASKDDPTAPPRLLVRYFPPPAN
jgi:hypothetical protein